MATANATSSSGEVQVLSADINKATRSLHTQLNRHITSRLPLSLPPHASSPGTYATGLEHFAHVFLTFESLFHDIASQNSVNNPALSALLEDPWVHVPQDVKASPSPSDTPTPASAHDIEIQSFLASLLPRGMPRSRRLLADLAYLRKQHPANLSASLSQFPSKIAHEFTTHVRKEATRKPHVLIAYAWCFYMAVFSGGRWIRGQLMAAGNDFWQSGKDASQSTTTHVTPDTGLSFFNFDGEEDGEDIKKEFKERLAAGEAILLPEERNEIVEEAKNIFRFCNSLVEELDQILMTPESIVAGRKLPAGAPKKELPSLDIAEKPITNPVWNNFRLGPSSVVMAALVVGCVSWYTSYTAGAP